MKAPEGKAQTRIERQCWWPKPEENSRSRETNRTDHGTVRASDLRPTTSTNYWPRPPALESTWHMVPSSPSFNVLGDSSADADALSVLRITGINSQTDFDKMFLSNLF